MFGDEVMCEMISPFQDLVDAADISVLSEAANETTQRSRSVLAKRQLHVFKSGGNGFLGHAAEYKQVDECLLEAVAEEQRKPGRRAAARGQPLGARGVVVVECLQVRGPWL